MVTVKRTNPTSQQQSKEKVESKQKPVQIRENPFGRKNVSWWKFWGNDKDYGKRIRLTSQQVKEAQALLDSKQEAVVNVLEENYEAIPEPQAIEPVLFLMKETGYIDVLENVKTGEFIIATPKGEKSIWLTPDKLQSIKIGERYYRGWVAYENCMTPYPEDPIYSAELQRKIHQKIAINYQNLNEVALMNAKTKFWVAVIGIVLLGLVMVFSTDFGQNLFASAAGWFSGGGGTQAATEAANQAAQQTAQTVGQSVVNTGVTVQ